MCLFFLSNDIVWAMHHKKYLTNVMYGANLSCEHYLFGDILEQCIIKTSLM